MGEKFEESLLLSKGKIKSPERLHIPTSRACNNKCIFCMDKRVKDGKYIIPPYYEIEKILEENKNIAAVIFTASEPTLNPDLVDYIKAAKRIGYKEIAIITNGRRLSYKKFCEKIIGAGANRIEVSIHGHNSKIHDALTRTPGSFKQTLSGLRNLHELRKQFNFRIFTCTTLTKLNYPYLDRIIDLLLPLKIDTINFNLVEPGGNALIHFGAVVPKCSDVVKKFCDVIKEKALIQRKENTRPEIIITGASRCIIDKKYENYLGGRETIHIPKQNPDGTIQTKSKEGGIEIIEQGAKKIKLESCKRCAFYSSCKGIWKEYIKRFGADEFKPILK